MSIDLALTRPLMIVTNQRVKNGIFLMLANQFAVFLPALQYIISGNWIESYWISFWIKLMFILSDDFAVQNVLFCNM